MNCNKTLFLIPLLWGIISSLSGQEFTNQVVRAYKVSNATTVDVFNKYGKIHVMSWDKDSVKFIIDLRIRNKDVNKLNKIKDNISFEFNPAAYYVTAKTRIGDGTEDAFKDLVDLAGSYFSPQNQILINYTVMVPSYSSLKLENKFGDVYIDDREGNLDLALSYGKFKANNLNGNSSLKLSSGDADVNYLNEGKFVISYSDLHIANAKKLKLESRSSNISIDGVSDLVLNSRRDKVLLPTVKTLSGESYFTEFTMLGLKEELNYTLRYGSLSLANVEKGFSVINLNSEYTDLRLTFARGSVFDIEVYHHQDVLFTYPRSMGTLTVKTLNAEEKQKSTLGKLGTGNSESRVNITAPRKCIITLMQK
jgi:hypothetical protein